MPASIIEIIIVDQTIDSMVEKTRPRNSLDTCRSNCDMFSTELTATAARDRRDEEQRQAEIPHLAEDDVSRRRGGRSRWKSCACRR